MEFSNEQEFLDYLLDEIKTNRVVLPSLPEVAIKVRDAVDRSDLSAAKLAALIAEDAALAARLIQVANSPLYRGRTAITSLQMAVTRLGYNAVRTLLMSLAMQQIFQPTSPLLDRYFHAIWQTSVEVAAISRALAVLCPHLNVEHALLAGLIHQIGKLPILTLAEQTPILAHDQIRLDHLLEALHPQIGEVILRNWNFPQTLIEVVTEYLQWQRQPNSELADYVDVVQVAYLEHLVRSGQALPVDLSQVNAFARLGLPPNIEVVEFKDTDLTKQLFA
jgi:HD-like signal output (HDOD) protein